jgi:hypothetical protein
MFSLDFPVRSSAHSSFSIDYQSRFRTAAASNPWLLWSSPFIALYSLTGQWIAKRIVSPPMPVFIALRFSSIFVVTEIASPV